ncbi:hypothetical protein BGW36DRAFT_356273 [Talaromyces proteolyticus]|uniref:Telomeric single stranded DNA binding POT1/Cdc13 domain-containing protein n=1 Tax=Talaromyces proteolyticus TaxID=1131652 RepID=A0AAD4L2Q4_9EURO|nr:uncharacterized protein BGW36DRAFT_356273 [Talaromyces proteolyticus]KAH8702134.1 hypothetical protein BGW36DRAFT_356273 [Talaromyces proteolyticus]
MESTDSSSLHQVNLPQSLVPVAQLSPDLEHPAQHSFQAVVTLVWPFSSSNRAFSLLLAEPDYRLRQQSGQVRVTFCGGCAEEVARIRVGIGDKLTLSLEGAQWIENKNANSTPGRSIGWEIQFTNRVKLEAFRHAQKIAAVDIDYPEPQNDSTILATPTRGDYGLTDSLAWKDRWETPAFLRKRRLSSESPLRTGFGLLEEKDGYILGKGRKRPRFSFPSNGWRLVDESDKEEPSNEGTWFESDEEELQRDDEIISDTAVKDAGFEVSEPTEHAPSLPSSPTTPISAKAPDTNSIPIQIVVPEGKLREPTLADNQSPLPTDTPRLHPLPSPGLPTPSPIVSTPENALGYFSGITFQPTSQLLAPRTIHNHQLNSISTSNCLSGGVIHPGPSETTDLGAAPQETSTQSAQSNTTFDFSSHAAAALAATGDYNSLQTPYQESSELGIDPVTVAESSGHLTTEDQGNLPIDPTISFKRGHHGYERQCKTNDHLVMEEEYSDVPEYQYEAATEKDGEGNAFEVDDIGLSHGDQLNPERRNSVNAYEIQNEGDEDATFENTDPHRETPDAPYSHDYPNNEIEPSRRRIYHDGTDEDEMVSDELTPDDMDEEDGEADEDDEMSEGLEDDIKSKPETQGRLSVESPQESKPPPRNVYPEVIVIDSDSEDEPAQPITRSPLQYDDESYDESGSPSDINEQAGYDSFEELGEEYEEADDEEEIRNEIYDKDHMDENSDIRILNNEQASDDESEKGDGPGHIDDEELRGVEQDTGSDRCKSLESSDSVHLDHTNGYSTSKITHAISTTTEEEVCILSDADDDPDVSATKTRSVESSPQMALMNLPLVTRTRPLPTPQATQSGESRHASPDSLADVPDDTKPSIDEATSNMGKATPEASQHQWIDGSDDKISPTIPIPPAQVTEYELHGHKAEDTAAPEVLDEVVLVDDRSAFESVETQFPAPTAIESIPERYPETPSLRTREATYATLVTLGDHVNGLVDTISVIVEASPVERATHDSKDNYFTLRITDTTMAGTTIMVHVFHSDKASLPVVSEGDVIVLRDFKVQNFDHSTALVSCTDSAWAVFNAEADEPRVTGPTAKVGEDERGRAQELQEWYHSAGAAMAADHMLQVSIDQEQKEHTPSSVASSVASSDVGSLGSAAVVSFSRPRLRRKKSRRRITIHELRDGRRYTEAGPSPGNQLIHELRDGTVYAHSFESD